jgi:hypothetical protein
VVVYGGYCKISSGPMKERAVVHRCVCVWGGGGGGGGGVGGWGGGGGCGGVGVFAA